MNNVILYTLTVLIWGTTWFAVKLQVGHAPDEISILYRASIAAILLLLWCKVKGLPLKFKLKDHVFLCALGCSMFSLHLLFVYGAAEYIISGVISVIFSGVSFLSILNNYIFFRTKPTLNVCLGAIIGISGLCLFFGEELTNAVQQQDTLRGFGLAAIGAIIFSLGGSIGRRNHHQGLPIIPSLALGMTYGALAMLMYFLAHSSPFVLPYDAIYWAALLHLAIPGSIAFLCYLQLIKNIGPELASYTTILLPVIALLISSLFEGFEWDTTDFLALLLVIVGNVLIMKQKSLREMFSVKRPGYSVSEN